MPGTGNAEQPLRILHVLRAPIGGLWRHVVDLTREQVARGHAVGIVTDASTGGARAQATLDELAPRLMLGVSRVAVRRNPHPTDVTALAHVSRRLFAAKPDVVHGHGSKGGALARLAPAFPGRPRPIRAYTPHGGSLNFRPGSSLHGFYMGLEAILRGRTDLGLFESAFVASRYATFVGRLPPIHKVVHNGVSTAEFEPVTASATATDFVYVGELRAAKGIDTLLAALGHAGRFLGTPPTLTLVGSGPDRRSLEALANQMGIAGRVAFREAMPAREAFTLGRTLVVPSRAESLPYIVLEAAAARMPIIATDVGGIPEIFGPMNWRLIGCDDPAKLGERLLEAMAVSPEARDREAGLLSDDVRHRFSINRMVDGIMAGYRDAMASKTARVPLNSRAPAALSS